MTLSATDADTPNVNIAATLSATARERPYAIAVACPAGRDLAGRARYTHWTFRQLDTESDVLARGLTAVGIGRGVRTVLMVKPGLEFFALTFALFKAGAVPVMIDPGMGIRNLGRCLAEAEPQAFVGIPRAQLARRILGWGKPTLRLAITVRPLPRRKNPRPSHLPDPSGHNFARLSLMQVRLAGLMGGDKPFPIAANRSDDPAAILFTSGSTGPPKGAIYTHAVFNAQVAMLRDLYAIEPGEVDLCTFPLFALFAPALGMTSVVPEMNASRPAHVDPRKILEAIEAFGATNLFGSPALLKRVGDYGSLHGVKLPSLRRVVSAGAPVPAQVLERFAAMLCSGVQIYTPYGATEALPVASIGSDEILGETRKQTDCGAGVCVGRPVPGMRVEVIRITDEPIAAWDDDLRVADGTVGEFAVAGPVVTRGYFQRPVATRLAKIAGAAPDAPVMHRMGDVGYRDQLGRLWFCGRKAHRVMTSEGVLFTIPCEAVFNTHPEVIRTALVGVGPAWKTRPVLCVEPLHWPLKRKTRLRLTKELLALGAEHTHTRSIQHVLFRGSFPVDIRHNAKIFREKLAGWAARRLRWG